MGQAIKQHKSSRLSSKFNIIWLLFIISLVSFIVIMPFLQGLINGSNIVFSKNLNISFLLTAITILLFSIYQLINKKTYAEPAYIQHIIWLLPLSSLISQVNAASSYLSALSTLIAIQAALFFIISYYMNRDDKQQQILFWSVFSAATIFIVFGLMNWFNTSTFFGLLQKYPDAVWNSGTGLRLSSIFQYPNTYAAFLICFGLISLFGSVIVKSLKQSALFSFLLVPILISLLLTASRWGWLSFPVIFVLCLAFVSLKKQWQVLALLLVSGVVTLAILNPITNWGLQLQETFSYGLAFKAWALLIGGSLLVTCFHVGLTALLAKGTQSDNNAEIKLMRQFIIPLISAAAGIVAAILLFGTDVLTRILPANLAERVASINLNQHSVLERFTFYRDAIEIFKDYPIFGAGGGGWSILYQMYQNNPYVSFEVHSYYVQLLTEKGLFGLIIALSLFIFIYVLFIKSIFTQKHVSLISLSWFIIATTLLINSALDFHMSYAYIQVLLFIALGGMIASTRSNLLTRINQLFDKLKGKTIASTLKYVYILIGLVFGFIAITHLSGYSKHSEALSTLNKIPFNNSYLLAEKAAKQEPHPEIIDLKIQLLIEGSRAYNDSSMLNAAEQAIAKHQSKEPFDEKLLRNKLELYKLQNNQAQLIADLKNATQFYTWDITYYDKLATAYITAARQAIDSDTTKAKALLDELNQLEMTINEKTEYLSTLPEEQLQGRHFGYTQPILGALGQRQFILGDYEKAKQYLSQSYNSSFNYDGAYEAAIYYAATLGKLNIDYAEILNELLMTTQDATIEDQIERLILIEPLIK